MVLLSSGEKSFELHIFPPPWFGFVCEKKVRVTYLKRETGGLITHIISHRFQAENSHDHTMVSE